MPCDCGPDERSLWEKVRDQMKHHDDLYDQYQKLLTEHRCLQEEHDILLRRFGKLIAEREAVS